MMYEPSDRRGQEDDRSVAASGPMHVADDGSEMFLAAVAASRMPMIVTDPRQADNPIVLANQAFTTMTGYARAEVVGRNCRFLQGPDTDREAIAELGRAMAERREITTEILNYRKDGSSFWNALFISPVHDRRGNLVYFQGSQFDVSRRRDAEEALQASRKLEALGQVTGGIAHDFNNLLQVISGYTDLLQTLLASGAPDAGRLGRASEAIRTATDRATELTHQLCAFTRIQKLEGRVISLNALIEGLNATASRTLGVAIECRTLLAPDLWNARVDPTQAEIAVLHILTNAGDAMRNGGSVSIATQNLSLGDRQAALVRGVPPGDYVEVAISDTGIGMSPDTLLHVMEPFYASKTPGKGLGLATVHAFAKQSGGSVRITSELDRGTTVRLLLPASQASES